MYIKIRLVPPLINMPIWQSSTVIKTNSITLEKTLLLRKSPIPIANYIKGVPKRTRKVISNGWLTNMKPRGYPSV